MSDKYCVMQDDNNDCGISCLLSIIKYYGGYVSKEYLRELTRTNKSGVSALYLIRAGKSLGFEAYGIKDKLKNIKSKDLPIIAHVNIDKKYNHFIVIYKIDVKNMQLLIMDPSKGYVKMSFVDFINISTGNFLVFKFKQSIPNIKVDNKFKKIFTYFFDKYKGVIINIILLSLFYTILNILWWNKYHYKKWFKMDFIISNDYCLGKVFI